MKITLYVVLIAAAIAACHGATDTANTANKPDHRGRPKPTASCLALLKKECAKCFPAPPAGDVDAAAGKKHPNRPKPDRACMQACFEANKSALEKAGCEEHHGGKPGGEGDGEGDGKHGEHGGKGKGHRPKPTASCLALLKKDCAKCFPAPPAGDVDADAGKKHPDRPKPDRACMKACFEANKSALEKAGCEEHHGSKPGGKGDGKKKKGGDKATSQLRGGRGSDSDSTVGESTLAATAGGSAKGSKKTAIVWGGAAASCAFAFAAVFVIRRRQKRRTPETTPAPPFTKM